MSFPIGIAANVAAVILGGILGCFIKKILPQRMVEMLYMTFGFCALTIGIISIIKLDSLTVVILAVIIGAVIGELCHIEDGVRRLIRFSLSKVSRDGDQDDNDRRMELLCLAMAIICFSGTGIFGALSEGLDGDHSVLLAKSVLDLFTIMVIATTTGWFVTLFSVPQTAIYLLFFFAASLISPALSAEAIANFKSVGGVLTVMVGYNVLAGEVGLKKIRVLNVVPALILSVVFTWAAGLLPFAI